MRFPESRLMQMPGELTDKSINKRVARHVNLAVRVRAAACRRHGAAINESNA
jgi:hypothetical protein